MPELVTYAFNSFLSVFVIVDPFAMVPLYLSLTEKYPLEENRKVRRKSVLIALCILVIFALTGNAIFTFLGITMPAFQIAGGLLLLLMGIEQLNGSHNKVKREEKEEGLHKEDVSVFPLATPLLAGPGAIATVVLQSNEASSVEHVGVLVCSIVAAMLAAYGILKSGTYLFRVLGKTGLNLLTRIMGILLTAIAVQYIANGILEMFGKGS